MSGIAAAVAGSALIGGASSIISSNRASRTAGETRDAQIAYAERAEGRARRDANRLIPEATDARNQGLQNQIDFLSQAAPLSLNAFQQGNVGAQEILAGSAPQIQNAIMGLPINYDFLAPRTIDYDLEGLLAGAPVISQPPVQPQSAPASSRQDFQLQSPAFYANQFFRGGFR